MRADKSSNRSKTSSEEELIASTTLAKPQPSNLHLAYRAPRAETGSRLQSHRVKNHQTAISGRGKAAERVQHCTNHDLARHRQVVSHCTAKSTQVSAQQVTLFTPYILNISNITRQLSLKRWYFSRTRLTKTSSPSINL